MSEDRNQDVVRELFDGDEATQVPETNPAASTTATNGEESHNELELDGYSSRQEEQRAKQISAWKRKIQNGTHAVSDAPHWMHAELSSKQNTKENTNNVVNQSEIEARVLAQVEAKQKVALEKQAFDQLYAKVKATKLTKTQQQMLQAEYVSLVDSGLSEHKALEVALKATGISLEGVAKAQKRQAMSVPYPSRGNASVGTSDSDMTPEKILNMSEEERFKFLKEKRNGSNSRHRRGYSNKVLRNR